MSSCAKHRFMVEDIRESEISYVVMLSRVQYMSTWTAASSLIAGFTGSLENTGYSNGLPHWGTYLGGCRN